uniref:Synaptogyrin 4 n=1 Tax=Naja naja TaxID=35670 RepID=A0A8C6VPA9_NAJNA
MGRGKALTLTYVFSLVIFASLVTEGYQNLTTSSQLHCIFNDNGAACCYGITVGVLSFLQCLLFLGCDVYDTCITNHKFKYAILILDVTFSMTWTCLWFIGFCILANQWNRSTHSYLLGTSAARASIAFAFLSVPYNSCFCIKKYTLFSVCFLLFLCLPLLVEFLCNFVYYCTQGSLELSELSCSLADVSLPNEGTLSILIMKKTKLRKHQGLHSSTLNNNIIFYWNHTPVTHFLQRLVPGHK